MADETFDNLVVNKRLGIGISEPAAQLHIATATTEGISSQVLTKVVKEQQKTISVLAKKIQALEKQN